VLAEASSCFAIQPIIESEYRGAVFREEHSFLLRRQIMRLESPAMTRRARAERFMRLCNLSGLLVLLLAVATLSTAAKMSWYLPQGDAGHNLTAAVKMKVAHPPIIFEGLPLQPVVKVAPPLPEIRTSRPVEPEAEIPSIGITVSLQHRSPPSQNS
jgi:hypothetical protein